MTQQIELNKRRFLSASNLCQRLPGAALGAKADSSGIEINPDRSWVVPKVRFAEDFILEHSLAGPHVMSMEISGIF